MAKVDNKAVFKKFDDFLKGVENQEEAKDPLSMAVKDFVDILHKELERNDLIANGKLYQSIIPLPVEVQPGVVKVSIQLEDYWRDVDEGTKPKGFTKENRKKLQPRILAWIGDKPSLQQLAGSKEKERSLSYAIATNILKKGTIKRFGYKGSGFVSRNMDEFKKNIIKAFEEAYKYK